MSIIKALSEAADHARILGRPDPVILTDRNTANALARGIARELGDLVFFDRVQMPHGVVGMYDGVQIRAAKPRVRVKMGRRVVVGAHDWPVDWEGVRRAARENLRQWALQRLVPREGA